MSFYSKDRILVVDDVSQDLQIINEALSQGGFEAHGVNHGDAAFEHLETSPRLPDLILLDVNMPGMSGLEVLAGLKMDSRWSEIPVILMTGGAGNDEEQGLEMGASDWVQKPITPGALVVRIHHHLRNQRQKHRAMLVNKETQEASSQAVHSIAKNLRENVNGIGGHWEQFLKQFGNDATICTPAMREEMQGLLHQIRADLTRLVRITEGVD